MIESYIKEGGRFTDMIEEMELNDVFGPPQTEGLAESRYEKWRQIDPFPAIPPALLNTANIYDYVCKTGMICPFVLQEGKDKYLNNATYSVRIEGEVRYFKKDSDGSIIKVRKKLVKKGDEFRLEPNSIAYVTLEPYFRVPKYIVLRFNLKIKHIYKGLLLGTGPIVDPGFEGRLSIPLHNFTSNEYVFKYHDELIQMEFTKMSTHQIDKYEYRFDCEENSVENKKGRDVDNYLSKALKETGNTYVISSIPDAMDKAKRDAAKAKKGARKLEKKADWTLKFNLLVIATIIISCMAICFATINSVNTRIDRLESEIQSYKGKTKSELKDSSQIVDEPIEINEKNQDDNQ